MNITIEGSEQEIQTLVGHLHDIVKDNPVMLARYILLGVLNHHHVVESVGATPNLMDNFVDVSRRVDIYCNTEIRNDIELNYIN